MKVKKIMKMTGDVVEQIIQIAMCRKGFRKIEQRPVLLHLQIRTLNSVDSQPPASLQFQE